MKGYEYTYDIKPSEKQLNWQKNEYYGCIYFGMGTFAGENGGLGCSVPTTFFPEKLDADLWAETALKAGMSGLLLNVKNSDGFCLWQTETTDYSVKSSNWENGKGDLVKMLSDSCKKFGIKFGIDMAFADLHEKTFKTDRKKYNEILKKQVAELVTNYGELFEFRIFDGDDIPLHNIDYNEIFNIIYTAQPNIVISCEGPDVRWVGNNRNVVRKAEWSVVPKQYIDLSARVNDSPVNRMSLDIGSRNTIKKETEFVWYPCEVNVPIRPHLYYDKEDNYSVKAKDKLHKIYEATVGANATMMLCICPDKKGEFYDIDSQILNSFGFDLKTIYSSNILTNENAKIFSSSQFSDLNKIQNVMNEDDNLIWKIGEKDKKAEINIKFKESFVFDRIVMCENIKNGQHIEEFKFYIKDKKKFKLFAEGTVVGYKSIFSSDPLRTDEVKIIIKKFRKTAELTSIKIF